MDRSKRHFCHLLCFFDQRKTVAEDYQIIHLISVFVVFPWELISCFPSASLTTFYHTRNEDRQEQEILISQGRTMNIDIKLIPILFHPLKHGIVVWTIRKWILTCKTRCRHLKRFKDEKLQVILDQNPARRLKELTGLLDVSQNAVSKLFKSQKEEKWVPDKLLELALQNRYTTCETLLSKHKKKQFLHQVVTDIL